MSGQIKASTTQYVALSLQANDWKLLKDMAEAKGKATVGELVTEIALHYLQSLIQCPVCDARDHLRRNCTDCNGEGYIEQLTLRLRYEGE